MTASLYQRARSVDDWSLSASATSRISLCSDNTEDVGRQGLRVEADEISAAVPGVAPAAEQVLDFIRAAFARSEVDPAGLREARIEVHGDENQVLTFLLRVRQQLVVVGRMELQAPVGLQRDVLDPYCIQFPDQRSEAVRPLAVPALDLVLLGVEVFLAAGLARLVLHQLVGRAVDAVARGERRGEHGADDECRAPALLQVLVQDV